MSKICENGSNAKLGSLGIRFLFVPIVGFVNLSAVQNLIKIQTCEVDEGHLVRLSVATTR